MTPPTGRIPFQQSSQIIQSETIGRFAFLVGAGIFLSRITGLVRERFIGHYLGTSFAADAFRAALRIPNFLQNLFGEGALSASFIPVYAKLLAQDDKKEAGYVAGAVFSLLAFLVSVLVLAGVLATPFLTALIAPGFHGETRTLTVQLVRIIFPGVGLLVMSAWCLGILNSHRRFFLSYASTVIWNAGIVAALIAGRRSSLSSIAVYAAWGSVIGSGLQLAAQLPVVIALAPRLWFLARAANDNVRTVVKNFIPVFVSRGVTQLSAFVDQIIASYLPESAVSGLSIAQAIYMLPVSLFGMSISAAELPAMSSATGTPEQVAEALRKRIAASTRRIGFFVVPSAIAFLALGDIVVGAIYQTGQFKAKDSIYVWGILAGSAIGLVASTVGRLYSSAYYALRDTRTPLRYAALRVVLTSGLGYLAALPLPRLLDINPRWGVAGLTASWGLAAWLEFLLLRRGMVRRIGPIESPASYLGKLWLAAAIAAGVAWGARWLIHPQQHHPWITAVAVLGPYGVVYLAMTAWFGIDQAVALASRFRR
ncbi:MAG TPA: murein biosynthesis integral membrane protein MurJ [Candidatus Saccharimonadales bacterium]|nr:murein biosynthesis integral membrane protein MurJ [Candidatus Saccharimonadales bacterium]